MATRILIIAGEASGDLHGSNLVREIRKHCSDAEFFGIGGERMRQQGVELLYHADDVAFLGFAEVIHHLPFMRKVMLDMNRALRRRHPNLAILVDYPGFNLRFAAKANKAGIPVFYYIAPQVWAWGSGRLRKMAKTIDRMAVILPFEENLLRAAGIDAHFVGHPLVELTSDTVTREAFCAGVGISPSSTFVGIFPGSRTQEIRRHLPTLLDLTQWLTEQKPDVRCVVARAPSLPERTYHDAVRDWPSGVPLISEGHQALMRQASALVVASGTATLEAACAGTPFLIVYKVSFMTYLLGKRLVKLPYIGLVNVVAGRRVVPEFLQDDFRVDRVGASLLALLEDSDLRSQMRANLMEVKRKLGQPGAAARASLLALDLVRKNPDHPGEKLLEN